MIRDSNPVTLDSPAKIQVSGRSDGVFRLHLDDTENQNRMSRSLCEEMQAALKRLAGLPELKALVLTGRPDVFCAGASLDLLREIASGTLHVRDLGLPRLLLEFPMPVLAAMEGSALGGGLAWTLCCDLRVASERSRYGFNFADLGFTPELGTTALLPDLVGRSFAAEMLLTGKFYKGAELRGCGIFNCVLPQNEVLAATLDLAARMAEKPSHVLALLKETLALPRLRLAEEAVSREHLLHALCFARAEAASVVAAHYGPCAAR